MNNLENLTIVLLVKDTPQYLYRWLSWVVYQAKDLNIIIADGSHDESSKLVVECFKQKLPQLFHLYAGIDINREVYYQKIVRALNLVKTPYVSVCAPDDLVILEGFEKAIDSLDKNPEIVSCRGRVHDFECNPRASEIWADRLSWKWYEMDQDLTSRDTRERLLIHLSEYCLTYHDIIRTDISKFIFQLQVEHKILDPNLNELFLSALLAIKGPILRLDYPYLFRASRPNSESANLAKSIDTFDEFFQEGWTTQYDLILSSLSEHLFALNTEFTKADHRLFIHKSFRHFYAPLIIKALSKDTNRERFKLKFSGDVRPYPPLDKAPDLQHQSHAANILYFLQKLKTRVHDIECIIE